MKKIWIIGEFIIDTFYKIRSTTNPSKCPHIEDSYTCSGGSAVNIALMLSNLGLETNLCTVLGSNVKNEIRNKILNNKKLNLVELSLTDKYTSEFHLYYNENQKIPFFINGIEGELDLEQQKILSNVENDNIVIMAGGKYKNFRDLYEKLMKKSNLNTFFSPGYSIYNYTIKQLKNLLSGVSQLFMNENEYEYLFDIEEIRMLISPKKYEAIFITRGSEGLRIITGDREINLKTKKVENIHNTSGAGDGVICGVVYGIVNGYDIIKCGELGLTCASFVLESICANTFLNEDTVLERYRNWFNRDNK